MPAMTESAHGLEVVQEARGPASALSRIPELSRVVRETGFECLQGGPFLGGGGGFP
jgi:hypothetical protein